MKTTLCCPRGHFDLQLSEATSVLLGFEWSHVILASFPIINQSLAQRNKEKSTKAVAHGPLVHLEGIKSIPSKESGSLPYMSLKQLSTTRVRFPQLSPPSQCL